MNEKFFKLVANTGISNLVMGIIVIVTGVTSGVILIVSGAKIMKKRDDSERDKNFRDNSVPGLHDRIDLFPVFCGRVWQGCGRHGI